MKNYEFLEKSIHFSDKHYNGENVIYTFVEKDSSNSLRCWLTIPKVYHPTSSIIFEVYGVDFFYQLQAPSWFSFLIEKARQVYTDTNKLRHAFYQQKHVETILKEILLTDPSETSKETWSIFESFGTIATKDKNIYEDLKEALRQERYEFNTNKKEQYYRIYLIKI